MSASSIQSERERMLALAAATDNEAPIKIIRQPRKPECPTCRGKQWVMLMNPQTFQKEVGDCPDCGATRPKLPENSHRINPSTTRRFGHHKTKPRARL